MNKHTKAALQFARMVREERGEKTLEIGEFELKELRKDKERLDFIEKNKFGAQVFNAGVRLNYFDDECDYPHTVQLDIFPTLRQAIDHAMEVCDFED